MNEVIKFKTNLPAMSEALPDRPSFGGRSLVENAKDAEIAIVKLEPLQKIWNHSHSIFTWKHLTIPAFGHMRSMRQIASEMASKKGAYQDARFRLLKEQATAAIKKRDMQNVPAEEAALLAAEIGDAESKAYISLNYIEGAMKDILILSKMYDRMVEQYGAPDEPGFEKVEAEGHIRRSLTQCLRDLRNGRCIGKGEQEYLEQLGINPGRVLVDLFEYLKTEQESDDYSTQGLSDFLDGLVEKLLPCISVAEKLSGFQDLDIEEGYV